MHGLTQHEQALAAIDGGHRAEVVQGLIDLATLLATHTDIPVPAEISVQYTVTAVDEKAQRAKVDQIAAAIGETARIETGRHYVATREFGPVSYRAVAIPAEVMSAHRALQSYQGAVTPDSGAAA